MKGASGPNEAEAGIAARVRYTKAPKPFLSQENLMSPKRKLLLCLVVAGASLLPVSRPVLAALPCASVCCPADGSGPRPASFACMYNFAWTTCGSYWAVTHTTCIPR